MLIITRPELNWTAWAWRCDKKLDSDEDSMQIVLKALATLSRDLWAIL
jgi:hypothetical protein